MIATNFSNSLETETFFPLEKADCSSKSDHLTVLGMARIEKLHCYTTSEHQTRKFIEEGATAFGAELTMVDWYKTEGATPSESAKKLNFILQYLFNKHFQLRTVKSR